MNKVMKIAFILPSLSNNGPIIMVRDLVNYLVIRNYTIDIFYFDDIKELDFPCPITRISFFKKIDFDRYDIIHSHLFRPDLYCAIHKRAISQASAKVITTIHTAIYDDLAYTYGNAIPKLIIPIWIMAWKKMDHVVLLTAFAKRYYHKIKFKKSTVIFNGRDIPAEIPPVSEEDMMVIAELKNKYVLLGTVCAMDKRKGLEQIIPLLVVKPEYAFLIIGDGAERESLENLAQKHGVSSRFKILGFRPNGYRYPSHFNLFLTLSRSEGMPLALLEAIAVKTPIVAAKIPSISCLLTENEVSFSELDNIEALKDACEYALKNSDKMVDNAFNHYIASYTTAQMGNRYDALYRSLQHGK